MADFSSLQQKVDALKAKVEQFSITPKYLGSILDDFISQMKSIDMTGMSDDVQTAVSKATAALQKANQAITAAQNATNTASHAVTTANAANNIASEALSNASKALSAASAAYPASKGASLEIELATLSNNIGKADGIAPLDGTARVPRRNLPQGLLDEGYINQSEGVAPLDEFKQVPMANMPEEVQAMPGEISDLQMAAGQIPSMAGDIETHEAMIEKHASLIDNIGIFAFNGSWDGEKNAPGIGIYFNEKEQKFQSFGITEWLLASASDYNHNGKARKDRFFTNGAKLYRVEDGKLREYVAEDVKAFMKSQGEQMADLANFSENVVNFMTEQTVKDEECKKNETTISFDTGSSIYHVAPASSGGLSVEYKEPPSVDMQITLSVRDNELYVETSRPLACYEQVHLLTNGKKRKKIAKEKLEKERYNGHFTSGFKWHSSPHGSRLEQDGRLTLQSRISAKNEDGVDVSQVGVAAFMADHSYLNYSSSYKFARVFRGSGISKQRLSRTCPMTSIIFGIAIYTKGDAPKRKSNVAYFFADYKLPESMEGESGKFTPALTIKKLVPKNQT